MIQHDIISRSSKNGTHESKQTPTRTESLTTTLEAAKAKMRLMSADQLHAFLKQSDKDLTRWFLERAAAIDALENHHGQRLTGIPKLSVFRQVASGQVVPELALLFFGQPAEIRNEIFALPPRDQAKIAANHFVPVYEPGVGGKMDTRMVDITTATKPIIKQVISPEGIRSPEEQKAHLAITAPVTPAAKFEKAKALATAKCVSEKKDRSVQVNMTKAQYLVASDNARNKGMSLGEFLFQRADLGGAFKAIKG